MTSFPKVGDLITPDRAVELCGCFEYCEKPLATILGSHPSRFDSFVFDGVSGLPEKGMAFLMRFPHRDWNSSRVAHALTVQCALPHDLEYAYGELESPSARRQDRKDADSRFHKRLLTKAGVSRWRARLAWVFVRTIGPASRGGGGGELFSHPRPRISFEWGFATR